MVTFIAGLLLLCLSATAAYARIALVQVTGPEGQTYFVNVEQITTLRSPRPADLAQFTRGTHCLIVTTAGKFLATRQTCPEVARLIERAPR